MDKESLIKARELIVNVLANPALNEIDRLELMLNLSRFLESEKYDENIKVLALHEQRNRRGPLAQ